MPSSLFKTSATAAAVVSSLQMLQHTAQALDNGLGLTPAMGYSTWNDCSSMRDDGPDGWCWNTEDHVKNVTKYFIDSGLAGPSVRPSVRACVRVRGCLRAWVPACVLPTNYLLVLVVLGHFFCGFENAPTWSCFNKRTVADETIAVTY